MTLTLDDDIILATSIDQSEHSITFHMTVLTNHIRCQNQNDIFNIVQDGGMLAWSVSLVTLVTWHIIRY